MSTNVLAFPTTVERRARIAVAVLFLTNGALIANLLPRYPQIKADLDLSNAGYGLALAAYPAGAMSVGLLAGALVRRLGSARAAVAGTVLTGAGVLAVGLAPTPALFALVLAAAGAADALTDVAQNAHGLRVQRRYARSIINSFHAVWSIGAVLGGVMAAAAIAADLPRGLHLGLAAGFFVFLALVALRWCLPGPDREPATAAPATGPPAEVPDQLSGAWVKRRGAGRPLVAAVAALVLIAISSTLVEDVANSWAAVYLSGSLGAPVAVAAAGFIAFVAAQTAGRLVGDRLVDRFGQRAVARAGGAVTVLGMGLALALPSVAGTIAGFAAAGLGVATLVPAAMTQADALPGLRAGTGLTLISWLMRVGFLASPPLIGLVADATNLRTGLLAVPAAGLLVIVVARVLPPRARPLA